MNPHETIKEVIGGILEKIGIQGKITEETCFDMPFFIIQTEEAPLLIGERGQHLAALNYIVRRAVEHKFPEQPIRFIVDINSYEKKRFEELKNRAMMGAERVRYFKKEVMLQPMSAMERRIIHVALQGYSDITTESTGQGDDRRVVIKPVQQTEVI